MASVTETTQTTQQTQQENTVFIFRLQAFFLNRLGFQNRFGLA